jgi:hypothetical protein
VGVDALFTDGMLAGPAAQFDWSADAAGCGGRTADANGGGGTIRSLFAARMALAADLAGMGYGAPPTGATGLGGPLRSPPYAALKGREYMFRDCLMEFPSDALAEREADPVGIYFRACAHRLCYALPYDASSPVRDRLAGWWRADAAAINQAYQALREHMEYSRLLSEDRGVLWSGADPDVRVLWCCRPFTWRVGEEAEVFDMIASSRVEVADGEFSPQALCIYMVQNADEL